MLTLCDKPKSISNLYARLRIALLRATRSLAREVVDEMPSDNSSEPDLAGPIIYIGQDNAGHWLVQDDAGWLEGRFVSKAAAMSFAREEQEIYHARLAVAKMPLVPLVSFEPASDGERALARAA